MKIKFAKLHLYIPDSKETKFASSVEIRDALNAASRGKVYMDDVKVLQQVLQSVKNGTYNVANPEFTARAIKTAINSRPLSKQQVADLQTLAKTF